MSPTNTATGSPPFQGGGEVATLLRELDWTSSPLGEPATWPGSLRTIVDLIISSKFPMFVAWGSELIFIYNDAYREVLGAKHPAALGRRFYDIWHEIWNDIWPSIASALEGQATYHENLPLLMHRRGYDEQTWFTFSYSPVWDEHGQVGGMYCACTETTAQVLAERAQMEENERLRRLFAQAPGFMAVLRGPEHRFDLVNEAYSRLVGQRDVIGKQMRDALPDVVGQGFDDLLDGVFQTGEAFIGRAVPIRLQRTPAEEPVERFLDFIYQPIVEPDGRITGIFVEGSDVTDSVLATAALKELNQTLEQRISAAVAQVDRLWRNSRDLLMLLARDGTIEAVNPAWQTTLGYEEAELIGALITQFIHPDDPAPLPDELAAAPADAPIENRLRHRDGSWRVLSWSAAPEGDTFSCVARDVTAAREAGRALKAAEEQLRQAQKMEAVGQLTGGLAHDFNNLLQVIDGNLQLILRYPDRSDRVLRWAAAASEGAHRGARLTAQLLTFSRSQRLTLAPIASTSLVTGLVDLLTRTLGPTITVTLDLEPADPYVQADPTQLEMALINLAINARDAMPQGGQLTLLSCLRHLTADAELTDGEYVEIAVADTGCGMPPSVQSRAFDPFFTTKPPGKGTGLGLSQVYGFARQAGGTARIEARAEGGTIVRLLLCRVEAPSALPAVERPAATRLGKNGSVLLVDDDEAVREVLADYLRTLGLEPLEAAHGSAALALLDRKRPDLLLLDFAMPVMNGAELAQAARARWPGLPVIFATGYAESDAVEAAVGPNAIMLRKPFALHELEAAIERALGVTE